MVIGFLCLNFTAFANQNLQGTWNASLDGDDVQVDFKIKAKRFHSSHTFKKEVLLKLGRSNASHIIAQDQGTLVLSGKFDGKQGNGTFQFKPNSSFTRYLEQKDIMGATSESLFALFLFKADKDYISDLCDVQKGVTDVHDLIACRIHQIDATYIKNLHSYGFTDITISDVVAMKIHNITKAYIQDLYSTDLNLSADECISAKIHSITADYMNAVQAQFKDVQFEHILSMKLHDVSDTFIKQFTDLGYTNLSPDDLISLKIHRVSTKFIKELNKLGYSDLSVDDLISLQIHNISLKEIKEMQSEKRSIDEMITYKIYKKH